MDVVIYELYADDIIILYYYKPGLVIEGIAGYSSARSCLFLHVFNLYLYYK